MKTYPLIRPSFSFSLKRKKSNEKKTMSFKEWSLAHNVKNTYLGFFMLGSSVTVYSISNQ